MHFGPMLNPHHCRQWVVLVDDDPAVRAALAFAFDTQGICIKSFESAEAMLSASGRGVDRAGAVAAAAEQLSASIAEISRQIDSTQVQIRAAEDKLKKSQSAEERENLRRQIRTLDEEILDAQRRVRRLEEDATRAGFGG